MSLGRCPFVVARRMLTTSTTY